MATSGSWHGRYLANKPGEVPVDGPLVIEGIGLPPGRAVVKARGGGGRVVFWAADEPTDDVVDVAHQLAAAFPRTGLWPLLTDIKGDPGYMSDDAAEFTLADVDALDVPAEVAAHWRRWFDEPFAGLAEGSPLPAQPLNPFEICAQVQGDRFQNRFRPLNRLLLMPCRRPADSITQAVIAGFIEYSYHRPNPSRINDAAPLFSAVMRSWEARFDAYIVAMTEQTFLIAAGAPPRDSEQAYRLAAEFVAISWIEGDVDQAGVQAYARQLLAAPDLVPAASGLSFGEDVSPFLWELASAT